MAILQLNLHPTRAAVALVQAGAFSAGVPLKVATTEVVVLGQFFNVRGNSIQGLKAPDVARVAAEISSPKLTDTVPFAPSISQGAALMLPLITIFDTACAAGTVKQRAGQRQVAAKTITHFHHNLLLVVKRRGPVSPLPLKYPFIGFRPEWSPWH
ncbi:hypothetical protein IC615_26750 [Serratia ureilytica]